LAAVKIAMYSGERNGGRFHLFVIAATSLYFATAVLSHNKEERERERESMSEGGTDFSRTEFGRIPFWSIPDFGRT
jgi:hypothetical protein